MTSVDTLGAYFYCSPVPVSESIPATVRAAAAIAVLEAAGIVAYAVSILRFESDGSTSGIAGSGADLAPGVLVTIYLGFAALVLFVAWRILSGSRRAFTPYLLTQAFGVVVAQPLLQADSTRGIGVAVLVVALAGLAAILARPSRAALRGDAQ